MDSNEEVLKRLKVSMARVTYVPGPKADFEELKKALNAPDSPVIQLTPTVWDQRNTTYRGSVTVSSGQILVQGFLKIVAQQSVTDQKTLDKLDTIIRASGFVVLP